VHPQWLNKDAFESGGYRNEALYLLLEESLPSILDIVQKKTAHPITELFDNWMVGRMKNSRTEQKGIMLFPSNFFIPILACDTSLSLPLLHRMQQSLKAKRYEVDRALVITQGLLHLVVARSYLELGPNSDMQLFALACPKSMHGQLLSSKTMPKAEVMDLQDAFNGHFCRVLTRDERALIPSIVQDDLTYFSVLTRETVQPWETGGLLVNAEVKYSKSPDNAGMERARLGFKAVTSLSIPFTFKASSNDSTQGLRRSKRNM
jgi:hypothetical protein